VDEWLAGVAPEAFLESAWKRGNDEQADVRIALRKLYADEKVGLGKPPAYVAVLAFDGDRMGQWLSGENTPPLAGQFSPEARDAFKEKAREIQRPLAPTYHLQFSEALANFAIYLARPVVEHFDGQLIYAGGDDVLAMLPAAGALDCAEALRAAFQGAPRLMEMAPGHFDVQGENGGFVRLVNPPEGQPTWPLIVPGPRAEASVGLAIGHMHAPLQGLVRAAREAEQRAKSALGRKAFAVNVYKRSGEILAWGGKWDAGALPLFRAFLARSKAGEISGKFAYALDELIAPYRNTGSLRDAQGFDVKRVASLDLERVLDRQIGDKAKKATIVEELRTLARNYLHHLDDKKVAGDFPLLFRTAAFILRGERA
jgi:CRISPR/Cas system-associated protein Cas10 (large subunit of type III CRISPR-Cas system)